jgi:membrane protein
VKRLWQITVRTVQEYLDDDCMMTSAMIAFFGLSSLFPGVLLLLTLLSRFFDGPQAQHEVLRIVHEYLPIPRLHEFVGENLRATVELRGRVGLFSLFMMMWSSKNLYMALEHGLNAAWRLPKHPSTVRVYVRSMVMTVMLGLAMVAQFALAAAAETALSFDEIILFHKAYPLTQFAQLSRLMQYLLGPTALFVIFCALYKKLPTMEVPFAVAWPGALFAALAWKTLELGFIYVTARLTTATALYGAAFLILALVLWFYLSANIFYLGAELVYVLLLDRGYLVEVERPAEREVRVMSRPHSRPHGILQQELGEVTIPVAVEPSGEA